MIRLLGASLWLLCASQAGAADCSDQRYKEQIYTICTVDAAKQDLRLFLNDPETGKPLGSFTNVAKHLRAAGRELLFSMNAGMYHSDRSPVGYYAEAGQVMAPLVTRAGPGNFGLLPNGVFCIRKDRADVFETHRFVAETPDCLYASQSGPMLVIDGALHPRFLPDSDSRYIRNGVGTSTDGRKVVFAISRNPVSFHEFGSLFRDGLKLPQALYFDGNISRLYAPAIDRYDIGFPMGPMVGVVSEPAKD